MIETGSYDFDVVIAGGGVAGCSTAAALSASGLRILVVEPGLDHDKRLVGELMHPPAATDLAALGFMNETLAAGALPVVGFAVFPEARTDGSVAPDDVYLLPYDDVPGLANRGLAVLHGALVEGMQRSVSRRAGVELELGARVTGFDAARDGVVVRVGRGEGKRTLKARFLVAADGRGSPLRQQAGIEVRRERLSSMAGYLVPDVELPAPNHGHVFLGGAASVLAYQVTPRHVRIMFDVPGDPKNVAALRDDPRYFAGLPEPLRSAAREVARREPALVAVNFNILPEAVVGARVALVGDAGGCCHPLTATGISIATRDALRLGRAMAAAKGDVERGLRTYARLRAVPNRTRVALTDALYEAFTSDAPEMRALRNAILRYWRRSARGRAASLALLSTHDGRMSALARQYARVVAFALPELVRWRKGGSPSFFEGARVAWGLARRTLTHAGAAMRAIPDGLSSPDDLMEVR